MTSEKDQIQAMIAEIDGVLRKASPRLPWVMSGDVERQRRILEKVRSYLVSLQPRVEVEASNPQTGQRETSGPRRRSLLGADLDAAPVPWSTVGHGSPVGKNQQIWQALVQDLHMRLTEPLQADLEALQQQRADLLGQIRQLEKQRLSYDLVPQKAGQQQLMQEFFQVLTERLLESMTQQLAAIFGNLEANYQHSSGQLMSGTGAIAPSDVGMMTPSERLDRMRMLQAESDRLLIKLDSEIAVVFETLQRNLDSYEESLSQKLEKMHSMGAQGEVMFSALINTLAGQLGREASSFLQSQPEDSPPATENLEIATGNIFEEKILQNRSEEKPRSENQQTIKSDLDLPELNSSPTQELEPKQTDSSREWETSSPVGEKSASGAVEGEKLDPEKSESTQVAETPSQDGSTQSQQKSGQIAEAIELLSKLNININPESPQRKETGPQPPPLEGDLKDEDFSEDDEVGGLYNALFGSPDLAGDAEGEGESLEDWLFAEDLSSIEKSQSQIDGTEGETAAATESEDPFASLFSSAEDLDTPTATGFAPEDTKDEAKAPSSVAGPRDDVYISASPEENLLPKDDSQEDRDLSKLSLDATTLEQLNADLNVLENVQPENNDSPDVAKTPLRGDRDPRTVKNTVGPEEVASSDSQRKETEDWGFDLEEWGSDSSEDGTVSQTDVSSQEVGPNSEFLEARSHESETDVAIQSSRDRGLMPEDFGLDSPGDRAQSETNIYLLNPNDVTLESSGDAQTAESALSRDDGEPVGTESELMLEDWGLGLEERVQPVEAEEAESALSRDNGGDEQTARPKVRQSPPVRTESELTAAEWGLDLETQVEPVDAEESESDLSMDEMLSEKGSKAPPVTEEEGLTLAQWGLDLDGQGSGVKDSSEVGARGQQVSARRSESESDLSIDDLLPDSEEDLGETPRNESPTEAQEDWGLTLEEWGLSELGEATPQEKGSEVSQAKETPPQTSSEMTLEGFDDLFGEVPSLGEATPQEKGSEVSQAKETPPQTSSEMTLEGFDDLFGEVPSSRDSEGASKRNIKAEVDTSKMKVNDAFASFTDDSPTVEQTTPKQGRSTLSSRKRMEQEKKKNFDSRSGSSGDD